MSRRIMQFGTSRFLQAHVDLFVHEAREQGQNIGPITVVKTTSGAERLGRIEAFGRPDGFPVIIRGISDATVIEQTIQVKSIDRGISGHTNWQDVVTAFEDIDIVVSNTGDTGYAVSSGSQPLNGSAPPSFPEMLVALIRHRYESNRRSLLILPCELITRNGDRLRSICRELLITSRAPTQFLEWFDQEVRFANTIVDRIVSEELHPVGAIAEPYALWAIEEAPGVDIGFHHPAVILTTDLARFERLKLHILNLSHTVLADRWLFEGRGPDETVRALLSEVPILEWLEEIVGNEVLPNFARKNMGEDAKLYWRTTIDRLRNPFLDHRLSDIANNHSVKVARRIGAFIDWTVTGGEAAVPCPHLGAIVDRWHG